MPLTVRAAMPTVNRFTDRHHQDGA